MTKVVESKVLNITIIESLLPRLSRVMKKLLLLLLSVGFIGTANAGDISYECTIEKVYELSDTGGIKETNAN